MMTKTTDAMRGLAEDLRWFRRKAGLSQQELAIKSGVSRNTISAIECAKANPQLEIIEKLAEAVGCAAHVLFEEIPD